LESSRSLSLKFECSKGIDINPKEYWEEIIQLTFIGDKFEYLSLTRLPYENEIYIEYSDQINFLYSNVKDVAFSLEATVLTIEVHNPIKGNLPNTFIINTFRQFDNLREALNLLIS
jgi:hypothetical protein